MYQRILLPLDLSSRNRPAVERVAALATRDGARVEIVHVVETIEDVPYEELEAFYQSLRERAEQVLGEVAAGLRKRGIEAGTEIILGKRAPQILRLARDLGSDLIVLSSHRLQPELPGGGLGTISHQVALLAPCDVLLVR